MKSVGEVMAIGRTFEECFLKGLRMMEEKFISFSDEKWKGLLDSELISLLKNPNDKRIFIIFEAFLRGYSIEDIFNWTKINKWFLYKFKKLAIIEKLLEKQFEYTPELIVYLKKNGFQ